MHKFSVALYKSMYNKILHKVNQGVTGKSIFWVRWHGKIYTGTKWFRL